MAKKKKRYKKMLRMNQVIKGEGIIMKIKVVQPSKVDAKLVCESFMNDGPTNGKSRYLVAFTITK